MRQTLDFALTLAVGVGFCYLMGALYAGTFDFSHWLMMTRVLVIFGSCIWAATLLGVLP